MMLVRNLLLLFVIHATSSLSTIPVDQTVVANSSAIFWCGSNHSVTWSFRRTGQRVDRRIYVGGQLGDVRYTLNLSNDDCYGLVIPHVQLSDSGLYTCIDNDGFGPPASARLVVLDSLPTCGSNVSASQPVLESQNIDLRCELIYAGYPPPRVSWTSADADTVNSSMTSTRLTDAIRLETWIVVASVAGGVSSYRFTLTTFGDREYGESDESTRTPMYVWNSSPFVVLYAIKNVIINASADDEHLVRGETLKCHADGVPPAQYEWTNVATDERSIGPDLQLGVEGRHTYQCTATNTVANVTYSESAQISVLVSGPTTSTSEKTAVRMTVRTAVVIATVTTAAVALVAVCCVLFFYRLFATSRRQQRCNQRVASSTKSRSTIVHQQVRATALDGNIVKRDTVSASCFYDSIDEQLVGYEQLPLPGSRLSTPYQSSPVASPQPAGCDALDGGPFRTLTENDYLRICSESDGESGHAVRCSRQQSNDGVRYIQPQELMASHDDRLYLNERVMAMHSESAGPHSDDDGVYIHTLSDD